MAAVRLRRKAATRGSARSRTRVARWWAHVNRSSQLGLARRRCCRTNLAGSRCHSWIRSSHTYVDNHVVLEVFKGCNKDASFLVLEADTGTFVQAVEVAHCCDDGIGSIMRRDHDTHGQTSAVLAVVAFRKEEFKSDMLLLLCARGASMVSIRRRGSISCAVIHVVVVLRRLRRQGMSSRVLTARWSALAGGGRPRSISCQEVTDIHDQGLLWLL
jgi:hypothetical protein